ncbi:hypothetical protein HK097_003741 [Rhizophlyctis rosea]|uniref:NmrA-like domain-containing protein n=1 Tax=Rhizophlyctis rosea TaxID=64517 RepID=A0AAD5S278_9FUNG|nr:hypothetical protein HK097_003741 [Rhizophlyctis rosea]
MIILTGATGNLGSRILHHLLTTLSLDPSQLIITTSNLDSPKITALKQSHPTLQIRHADFLNPSTLPPAFESGTKLILISYPGIDDNRSLAHKNVITAAQQSPTITQIYYTSLAFLSPTKSHVMLAHIGTEEILTALPTTSEKLKYTIIREGIYNESFPLYIGFYSPGDTSVSLAVGDGAISFASRDELGEATARIVLSDSDKYTNKLLTLTGPESIPLSQVVSTISEITGSHVSFNLISKEEYVEKFKNRGDFVSKWVLSHDAIADGECADVTGTLEEVLGRKSVRFVDYLREELKDAGKAKEGLGVGVGTYSR